MTIPSAEARAQVEALRDDILTRFGPALDSVRNDVTTEVPCERADAAEGSVILSAALFIDMLAPTGREQVDAVVVAPMTDGWTSTQTSNGGTRLGRPDLDYSVQLRAVTPQRILVQTASDCVGP